MEISGYRIWKKARNRNGGVVENGNWNSLWEIVTPARVKHLLWNAGFNRILGTTNCGWCLRDDHGDFVVAGTAWDGGTFSILEAEALALKEAIQGVITLHISHVIFESDSQLLVHGLKSNSCGNSEFNVIIDSIKLLLLDFPNFKVKFVKRPANLVAHTLSKAANS
ncbi:uncharacterized protein LOC131619884 [Vicia villosa]|uniref:uncharacterized protein LOC131619884 n=1 Tax=Vicia villosa TaxID=3911 RepID=UPI00273B7854|nr:uncharacterized protein LOC131619884 [Vicia villosa]